MTAAGGACGPTGSTGVIGFGERILAAVPEPPALIAGLDDVAMVSEPVEQRGGHLGVTDHLMMPQTSTGESLTFGSLILGMPFMGAVSRSAIAAPAAARPSLWFGFRMGGSDQSPDRRRIGEAVQRTCRPWRSGRCTFLCGRFCR